MEVKEPGCVYVLQKGNERVSMTDHASLLDLSGALMILGCTEQLSQKEIKGHKQADDAFQVSFMDKTIGVVGQADVEKIIHWILTAGCAEVSIEKMPEEK